MNYTIPITESNYQMRYGIVIKMKVPANLALVEVVSRNRLAEDRLELVQLPPRQHEVFSQSEVHLGQPGLDLPQHDGVEVRPQPAVQRLLGDHHGAGGKVDAPTGAESDEDRVRHPGVVHQLDDLVQQDPG